MHKHIENIVVARNPQKDEEEDPEDRPSSTGNRNNNNPKTVDSNTNAESTEFSSYVSVIFVTASPTFTDSVAGYTTLTDAPPDPTPEESVTYAVTEPSVEPSATEYLWTPASSSDAPVQTPTQVPASTNREPATSYVPPISTDAGMVAESPSESPSSSLPTAIAMASSSTLVTAYSSYTRIASRSLSTLTPSATSEAIASTEGNKGMSSGGKAGLAIGIILIIALAAGGGLWYYWKKKKAASGWRKADDEKVGGFGGSMAAMAAKNQGMKEKSSAPRLSLGPQFTPAVVAGKKSQGNPVGTMNNPAGMAAAGAGRNLTRDNPNGSPWERRAGGENNAANPFKDPVNPFGDQATAPAPPSVMVTPPMSESSSSTNAGAGAAGTAVGAAVAGGAAAAAGAAMVAGAAKNGNGQPKNGPGSPPGARMAAGAPPPSNVHRVQLDFRPSMEDELELRAGQLVRILHEYDDGWVCLKHHWDSSFLLTYFLGTLYSS